MVLKAVNTYRYGNRIPPDPRDIDQDLRILIERDIDHLESVLTELQTLVLLDADDAHAMQLRARLRSLLSPLAPRSVWRFHEGWNESLAAWIDHDRRWLRREPDGPVISFGRPARQIFLESLRGRPQYGPHPIPHPLPLHAGLMRRILQATRRGPAPGTADGSWAVESRLESFLTAVLPAPWRLLGVDTESFGLDSGLGHPLTEGVRGWIFHREGVDGVGLMVEIRVHERQRLNRGMAARLWVLLPGIEPPGWFGRMPARDRHRFDELWSHLGGDTAEAMDGSIADLAGVLRELAGRLEAPDWAGLRVRIAGIKPEEPLSPRLLAEVAYHLGGVESPGKRDRALLESLLCRMIDAAPWQDVKGFVPRVVRSISPLPKKKLEALMKAVARACPEPPGPSDLPFIFWLGREQKSGQDSLEKLHQHLEHALSWPTARAQFHSHMRRALAKGSRHLDPAGWAEILSRLTEGFDAAPFSEVPAWITSLSRILGVGQQTGLTRNDILEFSTHVIAQSLLVAAPWPQPGVWQIRHHHEEFLQSLATFRQLTFELGLEEWDFARLDWCHAALPRWIQGGPPSQFPAVYWTLIRHWLSRKTPRQRTVETFCRDVLTARIRSELDSGREDEAITVGLEHSIPFSRICQWFNGPSPWPRSGLQKSRNTLIRHIFDVINETGEIPEDDSISLRGGSLLLDLASRPSDQTTADAQGSGIIADAAVREFLIRFFVDLPDTVQDDDGIRAWLTRTLDQPKTATLEEVTPHIARVFCKQFQSTSSLESWRQLLGRLPLLKGDEHPDILAALERSVGSGDIVPGEENSRTWICLSLLVRVRAGISAAFRPFRRPHGKDGGVPSTWLYLSDDRRCQAGCMDETKSA